MNPQRLLLNAFVALTLLPLASAQADMIGTERLEREAQQLERVVNLSQVGYYLRDGVARFRARAADLAFCERRNDYRPYPGRPVPPYRPRPESCEVELRMTQQAFDDVDQDLASTYYQDSSVYNQYVRTADALNDIFFGGSPGGGPVHPIELRAVGQLEGIQFHLRGARAQINRQCQDIVRRYGLRVVRSLSVNGQTLVAGPYQQISALQACRLVANHAR